MPNHVTNQLTISGPSEELRHFRGAARSENSEFAMDNFMSVPQALHQFPNRDAATLDQAAENTRYYGQPSRYHWRMEHWGTGRDAGHVHVKTRPDGSLEYFFMTDWSPFSKNAWATVAARFPGLSFHMTYDEPLRELTGDLKAENGQITHSVYRRYTAEEAEAMWGHPATGPEPETVPVPAS